jgi:hypothetical protein
MNWGLLPTTVRIRTGAAYALAGCGERTSMLPAAQPTVLVCTAEIAAFTASIERSVADPASVMQLTVAVLAAAGELTAIESGIEPDAP